MSKKKGKEPDYIDEKFGIPAEPPDPEPTGEEPPDGLQRGEEAGQEGKEEGKEAVESGGDAPEAARTTEEVAEVRDPVETPPAKAPPAKSEEEIRQDELLEAKRREAAMSQEIARLRREIRESNQSQPPPAQPAPHPTPQQMAPAMQPPKRQFELDDAGNVVETEESIKATDAYYRILMDNRIAEAMRPDPQQVWMQKLESAKQQWSAGDPLRYQEATKIQRATESMVLLSQHYEATTGHSPKSFGEWLDVVDSTDLGQRFQAMHPEVQNVKAFLRAFFLPTPDESVRIELMKDYMDWHMLGLGGTVPGGNGEGDGGGMVVPLQRGKPRPMAQKGRSVDQGTTDEQELAALDDRARQNPLPSMANALNEEDQKRQAYLRRKLGRPM